MDAQHVLTIITCLETSEIPVVLDGGWGVDALLGEQTRPHDDLDIVVGRADMERIQVALGVLGFSHAREVQPGLPARFVLRDAAGHQVDCHMVVFDESGNAHQQLSDTAWGLYPAKGLAGSGFILGRKVRCITPELQIEHHLGYEPDDLDRADLDRLACRFRLLLPEPYRDRRTDA
jgi:lincosamide nucleotidyltransferase A/C/D/E